MDTMVPADFDYAKFWASIMALVVAVLGIAFKYKLVTRSDDPAKPETERLSGLGWAAMALVLLGGGFSIYSDVKNQQKKETSTKELRQELGTSREAQERLNRTTDSLTREMRATLAAMQRTAGDSAARAAPVDRQP